MSAPETTVGPETRRQTGSGVGALLDSVFGYIVWAVHFLAIYIATAVSCQLGLGAASAGAGTIFLAILIVVTLAAGGVVVAHGVRRYRQLRDRSDKRFRLAVTIGNDAVATVAIVWQVLAVSLVPLCA